MNCLDDNWMMKGCLNCFKILLKQKGDHVKMNQMPLKRKGVGQCNIEIMDELTRVQLHKC